MLRDGIQSGLVWSYSFADCPENEKNAMKNMATEKQDIQISLDFS